MKLFVQAYLFQDPGNKHGKELGGTLFFSAILLYPKPRSSNLWENRETIFSVDWNFHDGKSHYEISAGEFVRRSINT